jgi:hypothetical protein
MKSNLSMVLVLAIALFTLVWNVRGRTQSSLSPIWEYKVLSTGDEKKINELAAQRYELFMVSPSGTSGGTSHGDPHLYFRRPK